MKNSNEHRTLKNKPLVQGPNTIFSFLQKSNENPDAFFKAQAPHAQAPAQPLFKPYSVGHLSSLLARINFLLSLPIQPVTPAPNKS